jgi:pimeloyl-ACP methyl ester carboxylesterase
MRKALIILCATIGVLVIGSYGWLFYSTDKNLAIPAPEALAALDGDPRIAVSSGDWLVMQPENSVATKGVILYPGANCDIRGYAPILKELAAAGYLVAVVSMPFDMAIFAPNRADDVRAAFPNISSWALIGHSMGGAMAGFYAHNNPEKIDVLIMWDAYPPDSKSLKDAAFPVVHIHRADENGLPPEKFAKKRYLFPADSEWHGIPGGAHMYFGSFVGGGYVESRQPTIARDEQHEIVITETLAALASM